LCNISDFDLAGDFMPQSVARQIEYWVKHYTPQADIALQPLALTRTQVVSISYREYPSKSLIYADDIKAELNNLDQQASTNIRNTSSVLYDGFLQVTNSSSDSLTLALIPLPFIKGE
jgi:hypothetical protein